MISLIAAIDSDGKIGVNGGLLCNLPNDLRFFKETTSGHTVVMGRKTFESIGRPLPNRENIVLTRNGYHFREEHPYAKYCLSGNLFAVRDHIDKLDEEVFVIGGGEVYEQFIDDADKLYLTHIDHSFDSLDSSSYTYFPEIDLNQWEITWEKQNYKDEKNPYDHRFVIYQRKNKNK